MTLTRRLVLPLAAAGWILLVHMVLLAGSAPVRRDAAIALPGWPAGTPPLRIALVSDLHTAWPGDTPARLAATMATIAAAKPDLLVVAGDVLSNGSIARGYPLARSIAPLAVVRPRLGCIAVQGNHDTVPVEALAAGYARVGCTLLANQAVRRGPLAVMGVLNTATDTAAAVAAARAMGGVPVFVTHAPEPIYDLPRGVALALGGHTHCGQVVPPLLGVLWQEDPRGRYECGLVREPARGLATVVGAGLGTSNLPIRLGAAPEWWLVTIGG